MDRRDLWNNFLVNGSAALGDETMQLMDLTSDESTDLIITNPITRLLAHNSHGEINFQNNWLSSSTINMNRESDQLQQSRIEANQSQTMYLNANNHQQNFNIPSSSSTLNLLANPSRKRKLLDFSSQTSIAGSSSHIDANINPNVLNILNSQLGFNTASGNAENSRNSRIRINPPIQWAPVSNIVQPNTSSMPINQPLTVSPSIQNLSSFPTNVASDSGRSHFFSRYNATRNTITNLRSPNIQEGTGNRLSLNPPAHYQLVPQGVNNDSSSTEQNFGFDSNAVAAQRVGILRDSDAFTQRMATLRVNNDSSSTEQSFGFDSNAVAAQRVDIRRDSDAFTQRMAILRAQSVANSRTLQQELESNSSLSRVAREARRWMAENVVSFANSGHHRRIIDMQDRHRGMRLDVDNMSYEELLALEERMGDVKIGLGEEKIIKCLKQWKNFSFREGVLNEVEPCCICREEYRQGENMGRLDCGHDFHGNCIKKWLMIKNSCPICKTTALAT